MKRLISFIILMIILTIFLGCGTKEAKIIELSPIDSLGWNEDDCTFKQVTDMLIIEEEMFVSDLLTSEINVFSASDYSFKRSVSSKGEGPKETNMPLTLAEKNGTIIVSDFINSRIKELDVEGNIISNVTAIRAYDLFQIGSETIVRTYHSSLELSLLHKLQGDSLQSYLKPDLFFNEYVKPKDGEIPWYEMNMNSEKIIYAFQNPEKTTLCLDIKSGEISKWENLTSSKFEKINSILIDENYVYFLLITSKNNIIELEPSRLIKTDFSGNVLSSALIPNIAPSNFMYKNKQYLYLFDSLNATIMVYNLQGF